jgi:ATP-binding cassette subfamily F protein uup
MNLLLIEHLTKSFGDNLLFNDITLGIDKGEKIALIAKNGTGKSTLLNIIGNVDAADSGTITIRNGIKVAYLNQHPDFNPYSTISELIFSDDNEYSMAVKEYELCLESHQSNEKSNEDIERAMTKIDSLSAWDYEHKIKEILSKFDIHNLQQKVNQLSGGQKKKIALAKALIDEADILIMDEPTNHLDIDMIEWLEDYLQRNNSTLLMVTHDRYFLNQVCDTIVELENQKLYKYKGNYEYYLEKKDERQMVEMAETEKSKNLFKNELEWMRRMPQARGTKSKARIDAFYELKEKALVQSNKELSGFGVLAERLGSKIVEIHNVDFSYKERVILTDFSYVFKKGERIGIVGPNGCGKSTLLKLITNFISPDKGKIDIGQTVKIGYYAQDGLQLNESRRVIDIVKDHAEVIKLKNGSELSAAQFLVNFGFSYDLQWNYFESLSGGEKRRLYLLLTLCTNPNLLLLDEPTNDFDIQTMNLLEELLINFDGCVLIVSHDRYLLDKVTDHIFCFEQNGVVRDFYGSYTDYRFQLSEKQKSEKKNSEKPIKEEPKQASNRKQKRSYAEQKEYEQLEKDIVLLEAEHQEIISLLNGGKGDVTQFNNWSIRYKEIEVLIEDKTLRWMDLDEICNTKCIYK